MYKWCYPPVQVPVFDIWWYIGYPIYGCQRAFVVNGRLTIRKVKRKKKPATGVIVLVLQ